MPPPRSWRLCAPRAPRPSPSIGGTVAISDAQITRLRGLGWTVNRIGGVDRYDTAARVATAGEGATASNVGLLASGVSTIDALAGGPVAFKGRHPLFLTTRDDIPGSIVASMRANGITSVYILGGDAVVGPRVRAELAANNITIAGTLAGANRSETSVAIARAVIGGTFGFSATTFNVASGLNEGVDALGGAALSGKQNRVLLVTNNATSAAPITAFAQANVATLTTVGNIFGGTTVVAATLETAIETAAGAGSNQFQTLNVTPTEAATLQLAEQTNAQGRPTATRNADNRTYTVTGLNDALRYRITLVNAASIQGTGTSRTFLSSAIAGSTPAAFAVDIGADIADIVAVGGATAGHRAPLGGTHARHGDGRPGQRQHHLHDRRHRHPAPSCPLVYVDGGQGGTATTGGTNNRLETSATAAGALRRGHRDLRSRWSDDLHQPGRCLRQRRRVRHAGCRCSGRHSRPTRARTSSTPTASTFTYDANDIFRIGGVPATLDEFEARSVPR